VLGFRDERQAVRHAVRLADADAGEDAGDAGDVRVDLVALDELLTRLRGTGMAVSLISADGTEEIVRPSTTVSAIINSLNDTYYGYGHGASHGGGQSQPSTRAPKWPGVSARPGSLANAVARFVVPSLLPKPPRRGRASGSTASTSSAAFDGVPRLPSVAAASAGVAAFQLAFKLLVLLQICGIFSGAGVRCFLDAAGTTR
jgi:hypothetical protein